MQLIRSENPLDAVRDWAAYKRGELSLDELYERMRVRSLPPAIMDAPGYLAAVLRAAGKNRLTVPEVVHLEQSKGDTDANP